MSERDQTLMRTRCPECGTVFRVTSEQLRRKAGKVRCGQCQAVFNAFDHWLSEAADETLVAEPISDLAAPPLTMDAGESPYDAEPENVAVSEVVAEPVPAADDSLSDVPADTRGGEEAGTEPLLPVEPIPELVRPDAWLEETLVAHSIAVPDANAKAAPGSSEEPTQAARAAGLVAARDMMELSGHNRWSAGTLASDGLAGLPGKNPGGLPGLSSWLPCCSCWPCLARFSIISVLISRCACRPLLLPTTCSVLLFPCRATRHSFRSKPPISNPITRAACSCCRQPEESGGPPAGLAGAGIEPDRYQRCRGCPSGHVRRRIPAARHDFRCLPPNAEIPVKLWIEARDIGASGYRLYIFYP
jgi:predicted Zn finger-like uncharacterized protein